MGEHEMLRVMAGHQVFPFCGAEAASRKYMRPPCTFCIFSHLRLMYSMLGGAAKSCTICRRSLAFEACLSQFLFRWSVVDAVLVDGPWKRVGLVAARRPAQPLPFKAHLKMSDGHQGRHRLVVRILWKKVMC